MNVLFRRLLGALALVALTPGHAAQPTPPAQKPNPAATAKGTATKPATATTARRPASTARTTTGQAPQPVSCAAGASICGHELTHGVQDVKSIGGHEMTHDGHAGLGIAGHETTGKSGTPSK